MFFHLLEFRMTQVSENHRRSCSSSLCSRQGQLLNFDLSSGLDHIAHVLVYYKFLIYLQRQSFHHSSGQPVTMFDQRGGELFSPLISAVCQIAAVCECGVCTREFKIGHSTLNALSQIENSVPSMHQLQSCQYSPVCSCSGLGQVWEQTSITAGACY